MLINLDLVKATHEEYERRINAELMVRAALKASDTRTNAITHLLEQGIHWGVSLVLMRWPRERHTVRQSGQHEVALPLPINQ